MFAIIKTGGKQYKIQVGDVLSVEKIPAEASRECSLIKCCLSAMTRRP